MSATSLTSSRPQRARSGDIPDLGLPTAALAGLVALTLPRVVMHDLHLVEPGSLASTALAIVPLLIWLTVATVWSRRPLLSMLAAGGGYGLVLAVMHNLAWTSVWAGNPPRFGGTLAGAWSPWTEEVLMRGATSLSSIATGLAVGLAMGLLACALRAFGRHQGVRLPVVTGASPARSSRAPRR